MTEEQRRVHDAVASGPRGLVVGPLRAALHRPELADRWQKFGELLRYRTSLPPRLSELAILVTARAWDCPFEWVMHEPPALQAGLSAEVLEAIRARRRPQFAETADAEVYDFASELQTSKTVSEPTYNKVLAAWGVVGVVELTALIGYYTMVAMTLNTHDYDLPAGKADPFKAAAPA
jgi:4-carboxymuconolactone decarboxylase